MANYWQSIAILSFFQILSFVDYKIYYLQYSFLSWVIFVFVGTKSKFHVILFALENDVRNDNIDEIFLESKFE